MKKIFTLSTALLLVGSVFSQGTSVSFCDNFDSYQNGDPIAATSSNWETWGSITSPTPPYIDDADVTNILSNSGDFSLYFEAVGAGGPQDVVLPFGSGTPYTIGDFEFSANFFVNQGTGAYFNFQAENIPGTTWSLDVQMDATGNISFQNGGGATIFLTSTYPMNTWFEIKTVVDLTNNNWEIFIDNQSQGGFTNTVNKIASLDLYPITGHQFYVDDVCYSYTPAVLENLNAQVSSVTPITGLTGQTRNPSVEIRNLGLTNVTSFDVDFEYNGTTITENISGLNMVTLDVYQVNFNNSISLISGTNTGIATVYNVNGLGQDDEPLDDQMTINIEAITPAAGKLVIGEEATGTWCGWCPRGAVALNWMDNDYEGYWQGIAVHNGDPMTDPDYDNGMAPYISGYPSGLVDRGIDIDPGAFKQDFLQRIVIPPNAFLSNSTQINGDTLSVTVCLDFQNNINGNWKFACAIVEDSVIGSSTQYNQSNSYSGGSSLVDVDGTDWNTLPSSVHYSQMIYRHVGRKIKPSFTGDILPLTSYNIGDQECITQTFMLDPSWDQCQISIVGMLFDNQGNIDNASSSKLITPSWDCDLNGACFDPCTGSGAYTSLTSCQSACMPNAINEEISNLLIYPNPVKDILTIDGIYRLVEIYDIYGKPILSSNAKKTINVSSLSKGVYILKIDSTIKKLIKE